MADRLIKLYTNDTELSIRTEKVLREKLEANGFMIADELTDECELLVCIGGDGAFLESIHMYNYPAVPIIGINTGHLGFFQEISLDQLDLFIEHYKEGKYQTQTLNMVAAKITLPHRTLYLNGLNEIVIKGRNTHAIHLSISIGGKFIEKCSGDGILVATAAGSTAYNYSLGGAIVDPRIKLLQVTPIAPMNTTAYRSFTSSILLPCDLELGVVPEPEDTRDDTMFIINDGIQHRYNNVKNIEIKFSNKEITLLRFEHYYFWDKVKSKFL